MSSKKEIEEKNAAILRRNEDFINKRKIQRQLEAGAQKLNILRTKPPKDKEIPGLPKKCVISTCSTCSGTYYHGVDDSNKLTGYVDCRRVPPYAILGIGSVDMHSQFPREKTLHESQRVSTSFNFSKSESAMAPEARDLEADQEFRNLEDMIQLPDCLPNCRLCKFFKFAEPMDPSIIDLVFQNLTSDSYSTPDITKDGLSYEIEEKDGNIWSMSNKSTSWPVQRSKE